MWRCTRIEAERPADGNLSEEKLKRILVTLIRHFLTLTVAFEAPCSDYEVIGSSPLAQSVLLRPCEVYVVIHLCLYSLRSPLLC